MIRLGRTRFTCLTTMMNNNRIVISSFYQFSTKRGKAQGLRAALRDDAKKAVPVD